MPGTLQTTPALLSGAPTLYVRFGDTPLALLALGSVALGWATKRRRRHLPKEGAPAINVPRG
jgi:apolipoprotein N-acyltransferase